MEAFETTLTGSDGNIAGVVTQLSKEAYQFTSIDGTLHLTITKDEHGRWIRLSGSEPYFSGWVDELVEKIATQPKAVKPAPVKKAAPSPAKAVTKNVTTEPKAAKSAPVKKAAPAPAKTVAKNTASVTSEKATVVKKPAPATSATKKKTLAAPSVKNTKAKTNTDKKTTVAASASKKAKESSTATKK